MYITPEFAAEEILVYLRKSRSDDALLTVEEVLQKHETILDEWAENNVGSKIPEENKLREVVSGETIEDRPKMKELLKRIESPKVKAVLVVEVQRLSRGDLEDAGRLIKLLRYTNTLVITPQKTYDLRDDYDRDFFERELKRGNEFLEYQKKIMNRGRLLSVQQGNFIGSVAPYGFTKTTIPDGKRKCHTLAIKEDEANIVRMIFDLYVNADFGRQRIANRLDSLGVKPPKGEYWSPAAIKDLLENVHYIGKVKWNWRKTVTVVEDGEVLKTRPKSKVGEYLIYEGKHPAIVSEEIFYAAREKQGRNHRAKPGTKIRNPLAGILYCKCGRCLSYRAYKTKDGETRCAPRLLCEGQNHCKSGSVLYSEMIEKVSEILEQCIEDFELRIKEDNKDAQKLHLALIKDLEKKLAELEETEVNSWYKYSNEGMPKAVFDKINERILKDKDKINQALCTAKNELPAPVDYEERLCTFKDALAALNDDEKPVELKNRLLKACFERIEYSRGAPVRTKRKPGEKRGATLKRGGNWTNPPFELDVKLKV
jgi:DNA invertase Pin-like site-specific DNA recombinase